MKWNWTLGLMGTSENLTLLNSAPMYSRNRFEVGVDIVSAWVDVSNTNTKNKGLKLILVMEIFIFVEKN